MCACVCVCVCMYTCAADRCVRDPRCTLAIRQCGVLALGVHALALRRCDRSGFRGQASDRFGLMVRARTRDWLRVKTRELRVKQLELACPREGSTRCLAPPVHKHHTRERAHRIRHTHARTRTHTHAHTRTHARAHTRTHARTHSHTHSLSPAGA